jgi:protein-tyrosine phosphatase
MRVGVSWRARSVGLALIACCGLLLGAGTAPATSFAAGSASPDHANRALPLEGGVNFRDLGGYPTSEGRRVRWGVLYRSGSMAGLTAADFEYLKKLNISVMADFRSTDERMREPTKWPFSDNAPRRLQRDYDLEMREIIGVMRTAPSAEAARVAFASFYRRLPQQFAAQYREMFDELLAGNAPLAFNCSAGKDRTGVAAALVLTALGVPRDVVTDDYLLSNRYYKPKPPAGDAAIDPTMQMFSRLPPDVVAVFMGVDRAYLDAAFDGMVESHGSIDTYLEQVMGLSTDDRATLKRLYTEPLP